ncbi:glycosyltransferase family 4 protein [Chitinibacter fontanus]|uniref:Glycosyltransferase family 4 protein n=1 Tax=Chitinibacter fontanus TaxID=1737446 RepID=A0A7D5Z4U7_9NEIS|nr:glycosyltransferase family 4 protein [Chitinibacter fontanus]QLI81143.1 glycosyltransferase family 4 protein [Chitinibacter fontanus]
MALRVLHTECSSSWGGQELRIISEMRAMQKMGHELELIALSGSRMAQEAKAAGLIVWELPIAKKRVSALLAMRRWLVTNRQRFDVINTHRSTDHWLVAAAGLLLTDLPPVVRTRHMATPISNRLTTRWLYQRATQMIVTTGSMVREQLIRDNRFDAERLVSIPTGVDLQRFYPQDRHQLRQQLGLPAKKTLGFAASGLHAGKGCDLLAQAWTVLQAQFPDWQLVLVGDDEQYAPVLDLQAQFPDSVRLVGYQPALEHWLNAFDVFVLPSDSEGVPQVITQAMACAVPVVATRVGGIPDAVIHQETGLLIEKRDLPALVKALTAVMADDALREQYGAAGLARAKAIFSVERMAVDMERVFLEVCAASR